MVNRGISRDARKLARTPSLSKKKKKKNLNLLVQRDNEWHVKQKKEVIFLFLIIISIEMVKNGEEKVMYQFHNLYWVWVGVGSWQSC